ncbi:hypothetical protein WG906_07485 [Pedobacter sp. P351]|uniref:hypothetical protein n=1 Tax=Pedobacter superstes TaxID=3133441 RepID=UPI0030A92FC5
MKENHLFSNVIVLCMLFSCVSTFAQNGKTLQGVVLKKGSTVRISKANIFNKRGNYSVLTDNLGLFSILVIPGDTLEISHPEYLKQQLVVSTFSDMIIYLQIGHVLKEVIIKGESPTERLAEAEKSFKKKGIYYKGRPPLKLLSPFGGSPITFFYELFSKDGRRARRFGQFAQSETDYYEVASRFNDYNIKRVTAIRDEELPDFKVAFWPSVEQVRAWNDFDLLHYIKTSFVKFRSPSHPMDSLKRVLPEP